MSSWLWRHLGEDRKLPHALLQEIMAILRGKGEKELRILEVGMSSLDFWTISLIA